MMEPEIPDPTTWLGGGWMQTYTGGRFWPTNPQPEHVDVRDIAHALAFTCRYGGHVQRFYSVAEHCWHLSYAVAPEHALWALLHDAAEAYVGDVVRPLKHQLVGYSLIEDLVLGAIATHLNVPTEWQTLTEGYWVGPNFVRHTVPMLPAAVKAADTQILVDERAALLTPTDHEWVTDHLEPLGVDIRAFSPEEAERLYLERLDELLAAR